MSSENLERRILDRVAAVARALGQGHRLALLVLLAQGERSVEALSQAANLSLANASQHLQHLRRAGLVTTRREGKQVFYRLSDDAVVSLLVALRTVAEANSPEVALLVAQHFRKLDDLEPLTRAELLRRIKQGAATLIDVRPPEEFAQGHLPGAINIPLSRLGRELDRLPVAREVVAYCRGPYCLMSYQAVVHLRRRGFQARRLEDGFPEWRAAGLPVEAGKQTGEEPARPAAPVIHRRAHETSVSGRRRSSASRPATPPPYGPDQP